MVSDLRRVVKKVGFAFGRTNDFVERHFRELGARTELVEVIDVGSVVLAIMKTDCVRGFRRPQRTFRARTYGERLYRFQPGFLDFARHYGFLLAGLQALSSEDRGKVERFIGYLH
jgi:hypothetical protein